MLLMGDGYSDATGAFSATGFDRRSGAGRVHMHYPSSDNLNPPWAWVWQAHSLLPGQGISRVISPMPVPASATQLKIAMTWFETDYNNAADITLDVRNSSGYNCSVPANIIAADWSFDMRKRITLGQSAIASKCLMYRLQAWSMPSGQSRQVYVGYYFHSGNPADH
jgi:hypothetical protein